jgi:hypothetical protein
VHSSRRIIMPRDDSDNDDDDVRRRRKYSPLLTMKLRSYCVFVIVTFCLFLGTLPFGYNDDRVMLGGGGGVSALYVTVDRSALSTSLDEQARAAGERSFSAEECIENSCEDSSNNHHPTSRRRIKEKQVGVDLVASPHRDALQDAYTFCAMNAVVDEKCVGVIYSSLTKEFHANNYSSKLGLEKPRRKVLIVVAHVDDEAVFGASVMNSDLLHTQYTIVVATGGSNKNLRRALKASVDAARNSSSFVHPIRVVHLPYADCSNCVPFRSVRDERFSDIIAEEGSEMGENKYTIDGKLSKDYLAFIVVVLRAAILFAICLTICGD